MDIVDSKVWSKDIITGDKWLELEKMLHDNELNDDTN